MEGVIVQKTIFLRNRFEMADLRQEIAIRLWVAVQKYEEKKGKPFTYFYSAVNHAALKMYNLKRHTEVYLEHPLPKTYKADPDVWTAWNCFTPEEQDSLIEKKGMHKTKQRFANILNRLR